MSTATRSSPGLARAEFGTHPSRRNRKGVILYDWLRTDSRRMAWQLVLGTRTAIANDRRTRGLHGTLTGVRERSHLLSRDRLWPRAMAGRFRRFRRRVFAVNAADAAWVDHQCTLHPLSSLEDPDVGEASAEESSDSGSARSARSAFEDGIADAQERFRGLRRLRERAQRLQRRHRWRDRHRVFHPSQLAARWSAIPFPERGGAFVTRTPIRRPSRSQRGLPWKTNAKL